MFTTETAEVFGYNAVDLTKLYIFHHSLEIRSFKISPTPAVIDVLVHNVELVFFCELSENGSLCFDGYAVAIIFIVATEPHI